MWEYLILAWIQWIGNILVAERKEIKRESESSGWAKSEILWIFSNNYQLKNLWMNLSERGENPVSWKKICWREMSRAKHVEFCLNMVDPPTNSNYYLMIDSGKYLEERWKELWEESEIGLEIGNEWAVNIGLMLAVPFALWGRQVNSCRQA